MKYILIIITIIFTCSTNAQTDNLKVIYKAKTIKEATSKKPDIQSFMNKSDAQFANIYFELAVNGNHSLFKVQDKVINDKDFPFYRMALALSGSVDKQWYINVEKKLILQQYVFMGDLFLIESNINDISWKLINETKSINGYKCYKATCSITSRGSKGLSQKLYEVWYTPEIPKSIGPMGLAGLPGLVLEMNTGRVSIYLDSIEFGEELDVKILSKGKKYSEDQFNNFAVKKMDEFRNKN